MENEKVRLVAHVVPSLAQAVLAGARSAGRSVSGEIQFQLRRAYGDQVGLVMEVPTGPRGGHSKVVVAEPEIDWRLSSAAELAKEFEQ